MLTLSTIDRDVTEAEDDAAACEDERIAEALAPTAITATATRAAAAAAVRLRRRLRRRELLLLLRSVLMRPDIRRSFFVEDCGPARRTFQSALRKSSQKK